MKYQRLTNKDWHNTKFKQRDEQEQRAILKRLWDLENAIESGVLADEEDEKTYTFDLSEDGTMWIYEDGRLMAEISDVKPASQFRIFKDVVYEMRGVEL